MIEAYSISTAVLADAPIPFNTTALKKGCTVELSGPTSIQFNKCGIYMLTFNGTVNGATETNVTLYKDGIAQLQAQSTGTELSFTTLVQVPENNTCCPCTSPTVCQVISSEAVTFDVVDIVVTKVV